MTPDDRLDQLEPLLADNLQKTDRLIEGQGQILEVATRADHKADILNGKVDALDAKIDAKVDALDAKIDAKVDALDAKIDAKVAALDAKIDAKVAALDAKIDAKVGAVDAKVDKVDSKADTIAKGLAELTTTTQRQYEELKAGQEAILQYLREKLP